MMSTTINNAELTTTTTVNRTTIVQRYRDTRLYFGTQISVELGTRIYLPSPICSHGTNETSSPFGHSLSVPTHRYTDTYIQYSIFSFYIGVYVFLPLLVQMRMILATVQMLASLLLLWPFGYMYVCVCVCCCCHCLSIVPVYTL